MLLDYFSIEIDDTGNLISLPIINETIKPYP